MFSYCLSLPRHFSRSKVSKLWVAMSFPIPELSYPASISRFFRQSHISIPTYPVSEHFGHSYLTAE